MGWWKCLRSCWQRCLRKPLTGVRREVQCASPSGLHRMSYLEWGDPENPRVLVCVHGLTRNGRDFDTLAQALCGDYRVICPDVVGRGQSGRLRDPAGYAIPQYVADMVTLIARLGVKEVHWVGTSMGGLIGTALAGMPDSPIKRLVLNDVGPIITGASLRRIGEYLGADPTWDTFAEAEAYVRKVSAPFGPLTDGQWHALTDSSVSRRADGRWGFLYDPAIAKPFQLAFAAVDIDLWPLYEQVPCPTLAVRGAESDLLPRATWLQMAERGPKAQLAEFPGIGHAPMFMSDDQIAVVRAFLLAP